MTTPDKTRKTRLRPTVAALRKRATLGRQLKAVVPATRARTEGLLRRWPAALASARTGADRTTAAVQSMPTSTLRSLAAGSAGLGAGLLLGGAPRLVAVAGVAPAIVIGATVLSRSSNPDGKRANPPAPGIAEAGDQSRLDDDGNPRVD